jgi:CheY-like chemotaxis protein
MRELTKILYVEDEPDIQAVAKIALEVVGGFTVCVCSSGSEALSKAVAFAPDLILLDVMMPGMDGPATLKALKDLPDLGSRPFVFMTAKVQTSEVEYFKSLGAADVIPKPFDPMTLSDKVTQIWQRWEQNNGSC